MKYIVPKLGYSFDALEPFIDAKTMEIHHDKHHQAYVDKLNDAISKHPGIYKEKIEDILEKINNVPEEIRTAVRNHGGGHYNHSLFWSILKKGVPFEGVVADLIVKQFGSYDNFKEQLTSAAMNRFGSGWAWLVLNKNKLEIISTANQDSPVMDGKIPLLGIDVWEHAYYLKYQNKRADYVSAFFNIINWKKVDEVYLSK
jgi:superoxide dismutase, Fe-Mn family